MAALKKLLVLVTLALAAFVNAPALADGYPSGQAIATSNTSQGLLQVASFDYSGGGVCWLVWNNKQFINAYDHGRCLQSAVSFDWLGESFNPTQGGSYANGLVPNPSTSLMLNNVVSASRLHMQTQMAYWQPVAGVARSNHILRQYIQVGYGGLPNAIEYQIEFEIPAAETHSQGQFEFLTGYVPPEFSVFQTVDIATGNVAALSDGPGEQTLPIMFSTPDGAFAIGAWTPANLTTLGGGYGRWRFVDCVKWNMVARVSSPKGAYRYRAFVVIGTPAQVRDTMRQLALIVPH